MGNIKKRIGTIICWFIITVADIFVFITLGLLLMGYDDFYDSSKGEYWSLASMNLTEKIIYICYNIWIVLNIIGFIGIFVYIEKKHISELKISHNETFFVMWMEYHQSYKKKNNHKGMQRFFTKEYKVPQGRHFINRW